MNPIQYIFLNKELSMSVGKAAAQAVHACMMANVHLITAEDRKTWSAAVHKTVIILEARNEAHMKSIAEYLREREVWTYRVIDEG